jgi:peptidoglycan/xylan/chitin deacetylase (PgdA/CDA1 family)
MLLRDLAERFLADSGIARRLMATRGGRRIVLAYHNVVPEDSSAWSGASLHLPAHKFREQLELLAEAFDVVPLADLVSSPKASDRPLAAVTMDDAYHGAVTAGIRHLAQLGIPVTVFVPPGRLGGQAFWWDRVDIDLDGAHREHALQEHRGQQDRVEAWARAEKLRFRELPVHAHSATIGELDDALAVHPGLTLASHTWAHPNLPAITEAELTSELERPLPWLREHFPGRTVGWLAYPYGEAGARERAAASAAGYDGACLVRGGWFTTDPVDPYSIPRLNVPAGVSIRGFALRLAGLFCR